MVKRPTDRERINALEFMRATVYHASNATHWVVVDERCKPRRGCVSETLRGAIDECIANREIGADDGHSPGV